MDCAQRLRRQAVRGFTLIEVLVVVAIIALLVSILLPSLVAARRQARQTVCGSNLHEIGIALVLYQQTYRKFPSQAMVNVDVTTGIGQAFGLWSVPTHKAINKLIKTSFRDSADPDNIRSSQLFYCPEVRDSDRMGDILGSDQLDPDSEPYLHITYSYLGRFNEATNDPAKPRSELGETAPRDVPGSRKLYAADGPDSRRALMSDMLMFWGGAATASGSARWRLNHGPYYDKYTEGQVLRFYGSNLAFGDGHVEWKNAARFPKAVRMSGSFSDLARTAQLRRDIDLLWW